MADRRSPQAAPRFGRESRCVACAPHLEADRINGLASLARPRGPYRLLASPSQTRWQRDTRRSGTGRHTIPVRDRLALPPSPSMEPELDRASYSSSASCGAGPIFGQLQYCPPMHWQTDVTAGTIVPCPPTDLPTTDATTSSIVVFRRPWLSLHSEHSLSVCQVYVLLSPIPSEGEIDHFIAVVRRTLVARITAVGTKLIAALERCGPVGPNCVPTFLPLSAPVQALIQTATPEEGGGGCGFRQESPASWCGPFRPRRTGFLVNKHSRP